MTAPDPLADVFDGTADAPLPRVWIHGGPSWAPILLPHPDDPRWQPSDGPEPSGGSRDTSQGGFVALAGAPAPGNGDPALVVDP